jgi:hypothetical protein
MLKRRRADMAHKDRVSRRLSEAFKLLPRSRTTITFKYEDGREEIIDWKKVVSVYKINKYLFSYLSQVEIEGSLADAFNAAKLDPTDPMQWVSLIYFFSWAHFGDRQGRGAPKKWDSARLCKLIKDFNEKKRSNAALSDENVFKILGKRAEYQSKKGPLSPSRLRKLLKEAHDPKRNELLRVMEPGDGLQPLHEDCGRGAGSSHQREHAE